MRLTTSFLIFGIFILIALLILFLIVIIVVVTFFIGGNVSGEIVSMKLLRIAIQGCATARPQ